MASPAPRASRWPSDIPALVQLRAQQVGAPVGRELEIPILAVVFRGEKPLFFVDPDSVRRLSPGQQNAQASLRPGVGLEEHAQLTSGSIVTISISNERIGGRLEELDLSRQLTQADLELERSRAQVHSEESLEGCGAQGARAPRVVSASPTPAVQGLPLVEASIPSDLTGDLNEVPPRSLREASLELRGHESSPEPA